MYNNILLYYNYNILVILLYSSQNLKWTKKLHQSCPIKQEQNLTRLQMVTTV